jgi:hypothetical protein
MTPKAFKPNDRVQRPQDVYKPSPLMRGSVAYRYATVVDDPDAIRYADPEVYAVRWDHEPDIIRRGYFPHGLDFEGSAASERRMSASIEESRDV